MWLCLVAAALLLLRAADAGAVWPQPLTEVRPRYALAVDNLSKGAPKRNEKAGEAHSN